MTTSASLTTSASVRVACERPALSVIVPTRNERDCLPALVAALSDVLAGRPGGWELVLVDDSDDDTPQRARELALAGHPVRLVHREAPDRTGGLGGAVAAGFTQSRGEVLVVMDADLQHPPAMVSVLAGLVGGGVCEVAVASRYCPGGGGTTGLAGRRRAAVSRGASAAGRAALPRARAVRDPLSGFFAVHREVVAGISMRSRGFKVLLEVLVRGRWQRLVEVPVALGPRRGGVSKAGTREGFRYARQLAALWHCAPSAAPLPVTAAEVSP